MVKMGILTVNADLEIKKISLFEKFAFFLSKTDIKVVFFIMIFIGTFFYVPPERLIFLPPIYELVGQIVKFLMLFVLICFFIRALFKRNFYVPINKYVIAATSYIAVCLLSIFLNLDDITGMSISEFIYLFYNFIVFLIILYTLKNEDYKILIYAMICLIFFNCALSYIEFFVEYNESKGSKSGFFGDRIYYGRLATIVSAYLIIKLFNMESKLKFKKLLLAAGILFLFVNILLLFQRGAYLAYFFAIAAIILATKNKKIIFYGILAVCFFVVPLFGYMTMERMKRHKMNVVNMSDAGRLSAAYAGFNMWKANPVIGVGHAKAMAKLRKYEDIHIMGFDNQNMAIHNIHIMRLAETGLLGFVTFGIFNLMLISKLLERFKGKKNIVKECPDELFYAIFLCIYFITGMLYPINFREGYYWYLSAGALILLRDGDNNDNSLS